MKSLPIIISFILSISVASGQSYPANFSQVEVASGIVNPTVMAFAPDGRIFVAQQNGVLHVIKDGVKLPTPAIQLAVNSNGERGLIGIALHPSFATSKIIYLYYTLPDGSRNRVSRFTLNGDVLVPSSEQHIINLDPLSTTATIHNGGAMHFLGDKLFIAVGDNAKSTNAQDLETFHGKILRINADGSIPGDNPFYTSTASTQRKTIWSYGLRNPFTFDIQTSSGRIFVNDVGQNTWEEINDATVKGRNFGWPATEGVTTNPAYTPPVYTYAHGAGDGLGCAITGGAFFNPPSSSYPSQYVGKYFFQDLCRGWINFLDLSSGVVRQSFATGLPGQSLVLDVGNDGNLYFLSRTAGKLYKIIYTSNQSPVITDQPDNVTVAAGQTATFSVSASGATPLTYQWRKNGANISGATGSVYTKSNVQSGDAGNYTVVVSNSVGSATSNIATLAVSGANSSPTARIISPASGAMYRGGDVIRFSGDATDPEDGTLPASAYSWSVVFHHADHVHDGPPIAVGVKSGTFTIPNTGETATNVFYRLHLTATDSKGSGTTTFVDIKPHLSVMTIRSNPPGLSLTMDGQPIVGPTAVTSVEGIRRTLGAVTPQTSDGINYAFASWGHGGSRDQTLPTPVDNTVYTANFSEPLISPWRTADIGKGNVFGDASIAGGTFTLSGSGRDIYNADDHFRFVYRTFTGNVDIRARVTGLTNTHIWAKAGVMIRETLQPNSKHAMALVSPTSGTSFLKRASTGGSTTATNAPGAAPYWLRLVRNGSTFTAYRSPDGQTWTTIGSASVSMTSSVYVGLAVTSHSNNVLCTATMTNVTVAAPVVAASLDAENISSVQGSGTSLQLFPNPTDQNFVSMKIQGAMDPQSSVEIISITGQSLFRKDLSELREKDGAVEVDITHLNRGLYFVRVRGKKILSASFVKK